MFSGYQDSLSPLGLQLLSNNKLQENLMYPLISSIGNLLLKKIVGQSLLQPNREPISVDYSLRALNGIMIKIASLNQNQ